MDHVLQIDGLTIVLVGSFNPAIFHPLWYAKNGLIRDEEATSALVEIVHQDATVFTAEWFTQQVTKERFAIETRDPTKINSLRDLVINTFAILEHTPLQKMGVNSMRHYRMSKVDEWHRLGDHYAPKESWRALFDDEPRIGLRTLTIQGNRKSSFADRVQVTIEPSMKVKEWGVYINVHQHYDLDKRGTRNKSPILSEAINETWDDFLKYRDTACEHIFAEARQR